VQVDVVHPETDLDGYALAVAPTLHLMSEERASHLSDYVADGGHLLLGARTGYKDPYNRLPDAPQPGPLADLVGATVDRHESFPASVDCSLDYDGGSYDYRTWGEWLEPDAADVVAEHTTEGVTGGKPAVVRNDVRGSAAGDDGAVTYVGVWPGTELADAVVDDALGAAGVTTTERLPDGVRVAERDGEVWVTNFTGDPVAVDAPDGATWHVGGGTADSAGAVTVGAFDVAVVEATLDGIGVDAVGE
jgi:beta-galactosidase